MNERAYLPDIPLLPEEREEAQRLGKPKLPGAPESAEESILFELQKHFPAWRQAYLEIQKYSTFQSEREKKDFLKRKFNELIQKPREVEAYFDTLRVLSDNWEGRHEDVVNYTQAFLGDVDQLVIGSTLSPEVTKEWLTLMVKNTIYRPMAEAIFRAMFHKIKSPNALISLMQSLAEVALTTDDRAVLDKSLELLLFEAPFLQTQKLDFHKLFFQAHFSLNDDLLLSRAFEVDTVINFLGSRYTPQFLRDFRAVISDPELRAFVARFKSDAVGRYPDKMRDLQLFFQQTKAKDDSSSLFHKASLETFRRWPYTLVNNTSRLRTLLNEWVEKQNPQMVNLFLPNGEQTQQIFCSLDNAADDIKAVLEEESVSVTKSELRDPKILKALFFLSPQISLEKKLKLSEDVIQLRQEIGREKSHSISLRGDKMLILDEEIKQLGFKSITFRTPQDGQFILAYVEVGNYFFIVSINVQDFQISDSEGKPLMVSVEQKAFAEHLILSHLKELMCTERIVVSSGERSNNGERLTREKEFRQARSHLRKLPPGQTYSRAALFAGLNDPLKYDLNKINTELGLTQEKGQKTYVSVSRVPLPGEAPLVSRAPHATDRLKQIIYSPETQ